MSPILALVVLCLLGYVVYKSWPKRPKNFPPGPPRLPLIGSYLHLLWLDFYRPHVAAEKMSKFYGSPVISMGMGPYNLVFANDAETCREVFTNPKTQGRVDNYPAQLRTFGRSLGIFSEDDDDWLQHKRSTLRSLRDLGFGRRSPAYEEVGQDEVSILVERLIATKGEAVNVLETLYPTFFNMIFHIVHGYRMPKNDVALLQHLGRSSNRLITQTDATGRLLLIFPNFLHTFFPNLSGANTIIDNSKNLSDFLKQSFKEHKENLDKEVIRDLVSVYLNDNMHTSTKEEELLLISCLDLTMPNAAATLNLTFALSFLAQRPELLRKCQEEVDEVVGRGRLPLLDDRQHLPLIEGTVRESLRLGAEVPLGVPHRATEDTTLGGYFIPKDTAVLTNLYTMNRDPKIFDDPLEFKPERYRDGGDKALPFGLGRRVCVGETFARQNMFLVLAAIVQNFNMEFGIGLNPDNYNYGFLVAPNEDLSIKFTQRS